jgi:hypothetical protein
MRMKAYNPQWSENEFIKETAQGWFKKGFLQKEQLSEIQKTHSSDFYAPNIFLKIGIFIFTILAASFSGSIVAALILIPFENQFQFASSLTSLIMGGAITFILEMLIKSNKLYHSGIDNALLYMALGAFCFTIFISLDKSNFPVWVYLVLSLPLFVLATIRYADLWVGVCSYIIFLSIIINLSIETFWGKTLLPFIVMITSLGVYYIVKKLTQRSDFLYYKNCLNALKILCLATFYLGGNYLIVREGNAELNHLSKSIQVAFAPLFYFFTVVIPLAYIFFGLRNHDRLVLILGFLSLGFSIFTYRFYLSILPVEIALTLGGTLLIALAGGCMYYLRTPKHSFSNTPDDENKSLNFEALVMSQMVQNQIPQQGDTLRFGGGDTAGGGAGGEY